MPTKQKYLQHLLQNFPALNEEQITPIISENLISPFEIDLPRSVLTQIQKAVQNFETLRSADSYQNHYQQQMADKGLKNPGNRAMANSFDFHLDSQGQLKLIEMNTNAAFLALGLALYDCKKGRNTISDFEVPDFKKMILNELALQGKNPDHPLNVAIIDENPSSQRLYVEFLVYQEIFKSYGWNVQIADFREINPQDFDFIYNRHTDFLLIRPESEVLRKAWLDRKVCLSPHPYEYFLLADKERMTEWAQPGFISRLGLSESLESELRAVVPSATTLTAENKDQLWSERKKLFFKPLRAFGSKQSYKGASISRKFFDELEPNETLAQEYIQAPEVICQTPEGPQAFKYDLRCYAYRGELQLVVARLYQGQVTNLRTPYGGFACVNFN